MALFSAPSLADTDGAFCASRGYVAYEMREGITAGVTGHVLRVVRFNQERGIYTAGEVSLQDFQVHRMNCAADRVEISGWSNKFEDYVVSVANKPNILNFNEDPARKFDPAKDGPEPHQLVFDNPGPQALEADDADHKYALVISASDNNVEGGIEHHRKAEVLRMDAAGAVSQRVSIYENVLLETID